MEPVLAVVAVAEAVRLAQRAVPWVPGAPVGQLDVQIDGNLADVMKQCGIGAGRSLDCAAWSSGLAPMGSKWDCRSFRL